MKTYENFTQCYYDLINDVYNNYDYEVSPRGMKVREILGASFRIKNPRNRLLYIKERNQSLSYTIAETVWYFTGNNKTDWISNYSSFWNKISDDGITANSAYGARIFKKNRIIANEALNQWEYVKNELINDSDSRRAVIHIRVPEDSVAAKLDVPCTLTLQFFIRNKKLHMIVNMRSSDIIFGLTYDVPAFTLFQEKLANELGVKLGTYTHFSNSLHVYERHFKMCEQILENKPKKIKAYEMPPMPNIDFKTFEKLNSIQKIYRKIKDVSKAHKLSAAYNECDYFYDWSIILASHRINKLGNKDKTIELLRSTNFEGYHFFNK